MRKMNLLYSGGKWLCLLSVVLFNSCKKDVLESKDLLVYVAGDFGAVDNSMSRSLLFTPVSVSGDTVVKIAAAASREMAANAAIVFVPDTSLVKQYNLVNKTSCLPLLPASYTLTNGGTCAIQAGQLVSDSVVVKLNNIAALNNPAGYVLPLTIQSVAGDDKGVRVSSNRKTVFLYFGYVYSNIRSGQAVVTGTNAGRTGWGVTVSNTSTGYAATNLTDGNNTTAWRSSNSSTAAKTVTLDLKTALLMKGISFVPNYVATAENPTAINIATSDDNVNWTPQGQWKGTIPDAASSATAPDVKGIGFITPVQSRYVRLDIVNSNGQNRVGIAEINVVQ